MEKVKIKLQEETEYIPSNVALLGSVYYILMHVVNQRNGVTHLSVRPDDEVLSVKRKMYTATGIPIPQQQLFIKDQPMMDQETLKHYGIKKECVVRLEIQPQQIPQDQTHWISRQCVIS